MSEKKVCHCGEALQLIKNNQRMESLWNVYECDNCGDEFKRTEIVYVCNSLRHSGGLDICCKCIKLWKAVCCLDYYEDSNDLRYTLPDFAAIDSVIQQLQC